VRAALWLPVTPLKRSCPGGFGAVQAYRHLAYPATDYAPNELAVEESAVCLDVDVESLQMQKLDDLYDVLPLGTVLPL